MSKKLTYEFVRSQFENGGYDLLTTEYINCKQKLDYICPKGHRHSIIWNNWYSGRRCPYCAGRPPINISFVRSEFTKEGYILLTDKYINHRQKLEFVCPNGHKHSICWGNWKTGDRCSYCAGLTKKNVRFIKSEFAKEGYVLLTDKYENCKQKLSYICPNSHRHKIRWSEWQSGRRCPECVGIISKGEIEVKNFIESLGIKISSNDRNQIFNPNTGNGFELDIFMPNLNRAVEYNGIYWHKDKTRDLLKQQLCKSKDIELLTIWENEWKMQTRVCKNKIMKFIFNKGGF